MRETKQILDTIFATSGYTLHDYLADLGVEVRQDGEQATTRRLLTTKQACEYLQVSTTTVWRLTKSGALRAVRVGGRTQYDVRELNRFIRHHSK